jgi:tRNA G37 N-methylase Trm5
MDKLEQSIEQLPQLLNQYWKTMTELVNLRYHILIYKLLKTGKISFQDLSTITKLSRRRLYDIVDRVERLKHESDNSNR